jgi:lipoyl(octanoyl) transferase
MNPLKVVRAGAVPYEVADGWQRELHRRRIEGKVPDLLLLLEHPHVYTLGRRFSPEHLLFDAKGLEARGIDVYEADRGGSITYHGPGQLIGYPILDLRRPTAEADSQPDVIVYLRRLEEAIIRSARSFGVAATRREGLTGVWVGQTKLAAIGVNVSRGVTKHGFAINVSTDLAYYEGMIPCGIPSAAPTSLSELLQRSVEMTAVEDAVIAQLARVLHRVPTDGTAAELGLELPEALDRQEPSGGEVVALPTRSQSRRLTGAAGD